MINDLRFFIVSLIICFILFGHSVRAQSIERQLISCTGKLSNTLNYVVSSTSGETISSTYSSKNILLTNGFQQPLENEIVGNFEIDKIEMEIRIYPNPTMSDINLFLNSLENVIVHIGIVDILGKIVIPFEEYQIGGTINKSFSLERFAQGAYILVIKDQKDMIQKEFKILKIK